MQNDVDMDLRNFIVPIVKDIVHIRPSAAVSASSRLRGLVAAELTKALRKAKREAKHEAQRKAWNVSDVRANNAQRNDFWW